MSASVVLTHVRRGFYLDSVALMRLSREIEAAPGVEAASLMVGTPANLKLLRDAGLLAPDADAAGPSDLVVAVRAGTRSAAEDAIARALATLDARTTERQGTAARRPRTLDAALGSLAGANLAVISVPGAFAAVEARRALRHGLDVMIFSDNVPIEEELALKQEAQTLGRLLMGPDCGTALIAGTPIAFANVVPRGSIGLVSASGTGLQEVSCLIAGAGGGVSHGIGVGGRDLSQAIGGLAMMQAIDALDADPGTQHIVLISKPPAPDVARRLLDRVGASAKDFTICFLGHAAPDLPTNATGVATLRAAAESALGGRPIGEGFSVAMPQRAGRVVGLFAGGTMCAEAQIVFLAAGHGVASNAPVPGAVAAVAATDGAALLLDLGADEYTLGRPHPMIDPSSRSAELDKALRDPGVGVVLLDVILGYGGHDDPAGAVARVVEAAGRDRPLVIASLCGTVGDPQDYAGQRAKLQSAGIIVAPSNAHAAEAAVAASGVASRS